MVRAIILNSDDNVATLVDPGKKGEVVDLTGEATGSVTLVTEVAFGHKFATREIAPGAPVLKYGKVIGQATQAIPIGDHVHTHNVEALRARGDKKESK